MKIFFRLFLICVLIFNTFFINCATLDELENDLKNFKASLTLLDEELNKLILIKPVNAQLPSEVKIKTTFKISQAEKRARGIGTNILDEITEQTQKQLKLVWDSFNWKDFKEKFKDEYSGQIVGTKASIQKDLGLTAKGAIDPVTPEGKFLARRIDVALKSLKNFTGLKFSDKNEMPRIGCAFSGGGYRAMILTSGYLKALEDLGLLEAVLYISTLSGSTWYLGPWILQQDPAEQKKTTITAFNQMIINKIEKQHFNIKNPKHLKDFNAPLFANEVVWPKVLFDQVISSVDIYGATLAHYLLADLGSKRQLQRLQDQIKSVELGTHPWPIYTAVSMHKSEDKDYRYNWYEFNPTEIRNLEYNLAIPSYAFGRKFENGQSTDFPPGQSFGFLMGIFGSAYTINLQDIIRILFGGTPTKEDKSLTQEEQEKLLAAWYNKPLSWAKAGLSKVTNFFVMASKFEFKKIWEGAKQDLSQVKGALLAQFLGFVQDVVIVVIDRNITINIGGKEIKVKSARFAPAQVFNPFKGYSGTTQKWLQERELLTFVDAGIDYNIPLRPLLRPERDLDVVIVGDASGDVPEGTIQLDLALADIKRFYGLTYKKDEKLSTSKNMIVYRPEETTYPKVDVRLKGVRPPTIIYFNFIKDEALLNALSKNPDMKKLIDTNNLTAFDAQKCLAEEFCGTFNFAYSVNDYKQLSGLGEFNIRAHETALQEIIEERAELRKEHPEFGG